MQGVINFQNTIWVCSLINIPLTAGQYSKTVRRPRLDDVVSSDCGSFEPFGLAVWRTWRSPGHRRLAGVCRGGDVAIAALPALVTQVE